MAAVTSNRSILLVAVCLCLWAMGGQANASLQTQLDGTEMGGVQLAASIASSVEIALSSPDDSREPVTSGARSNPSEGLQRRANVLTLPGLAEPGSTSSSATTSTSDGGNLVPPFISQDSIHPGELGVGTVVAFEAMVPPEPPPSGLLKPPRVRI